MSTEHDATRPIPTGAARDHAADHAADRAHRPGPATGQPTIPLPRADARSAEEHPSAAEASGERSASGPPRSTPGGPGTWPSTATPPVSTSMRVGTVVWGLVLAVIGVGIIALAAGARIDLELAVIVLLALAGVGLVIGSVVTAVRQRRRENGASGAS